MARPEASNDPEGGLRSEASLANVGTLRTEIDRTSGALGEESPLSWALEGILDAAGVGISDTAGVSIADTV